MEWRGGAEEDEEDEEAEIGGCCCQSLGLLGWLVSDMTEHWRSPS